MTIAKYVSNQELIDFDSSFSASKDVKKKRALFKDLFKNIIGVSCVCNFVEKNIAIIQA